MKTKHFKKINSTNKYLIKKIKNNSLNNYPQCVRSDIQTEGLGRHNRKWESKKGGLYFSIADKLNSRENIKKYPLHCTVLLHKILHNMFNIQDLKIKWPNDLYYKDKKLAGVLTQTVIRENTVFIVIGIGVNVKNNPSINNSVSLKIIVPNLKCLKLNNLFVRYLKEFESREINKSKLIKYINNYLYGKNEYKTIKIDNENVVDAQIVMVNNDFSLKIINKNNKKMNLNIGEVLE